MFGKLSIKRAASDAEPACGLSRVAAGFLEGAGEGAPFIGFERERHFERDPRGSPRRAAPREGKITRAQPGSTGECQRGLHHVFELTHVARPVMHHQQLERIVVDPLDLHTRVAVFGQEMVHEQRHILAPLPQRRDLDAHDVEPVEKVRPKLLRLDHRRKVTMGGGDDPQVDGYRTRSSDGAHFLVLQRAQKLGLYAARDLADLVEKERAAVRHAKQTGRRPDRTRECPALMPKEFTFDDGLGQGAAVHRHKRAACASTRGMDRPCDQFLAGPALTLDEDVALVVAEALDRACERAHPGRGPHQFGRRTPAAQRLLELTISLDEPVALERLAHGGAHPMRIFEGLREVVEGTSPHAPNRALDARVPRHHHDLDIGPIALDPVQELKTRHPAHHEVKQDHLEVGVKKRCLGKGGVLGQRQPVAVGLEDPAEGPQHERLIVYQQDKAPALFGPRRTGIAARDLGIPPGEARGSQLGVHGVLIGPGIGTLEWKRPRLEPRTEVSTLRGPPSAARRFSKLRKAHVLVVDDEELYRRALERILSRMGLIVSVARDASEALAVVSGQSVDLVLCDVRMPGINGIELVRQLKDLEPDVPCIVITGYGSAEHSVEALRAGAFWYLEKPFDQSHLDVVRRLVEQAIEHGRLKAENRLLQNQLRSRYRFENVVGTSAALRRVLDIVEKVADTESTVLITGESGTGKELIARALHFNSRRADRMLVTVNCGAIPEELLESELFGHTRGAFTNAFAHREGRFSLANGGSIFFDEIGDMSSNLQVKMLRVLQDRSFEPVGSSKTVRVNVRVIAATNQNLEQAIRERRFREDLFYRLNVIPIEMPSTARTLG